MSNQIKLKPLIFEKRPTQISQILKVQEEDREFMKALLKRDIDNAIEEFHDCIQARLNALRLLGVSVDAVVDGQKKHFAKLESRGWRFEDEYINNENSVVSNVDNKEYKD